MRPPRRLLLLLTLTLLGAALLVRARLPRPQTEGDKWLWEQAESVISVDAVPNAYTEWWLRVRRLPGSQRPRHFSGGLRCEDTHIQDRADIRALLHAFKGTSRFSSAPNPSSMMFHKDAGIDISLLFSHRGDTGCYGAGGHGCSIRLYQRNKRFYLWRNDGAQAVVDAASVARFQRVFTDLRRKARQRQAGYVASFGMCPDL